MFASRSASWKGDERRSVRLDDKTESIISEKVAGGQFRNASETIAEAIRQMDERDRRLGQLRAALAIAEAQIERGEYVEWTPQRANEIFAEAKKRAAAGKKPKPEAAP
jgi:putative addiction module CopG family antidote